MKRLRQNTLAYILALPLVYGTASLPQPAWAGDAEQTHSYSAEREPGATGMIIDGLVVRPISLVATVVGAVAFVITLPFSALGGNVDEAGEKLVVRPAAYTFFRCLGCFSGGPEDRLVPDDKVKLAVE